MAASSNGADSELNEPKTGRFIMRAHQTYRVLLNAPILKQMKVGDSKGNEPSGKSFSFMVVEDRKPTPYMVKVSRGIHCPRNKLKLMLLDVVERLF